MGRLLVAFGINQVDYPLLAQKLKAHYLERECWEHDCPHWHQNPCGREQHQAMSYWRMSATEVRLWQAGLLRSATDRL